MLTWVPLSNINMTGPGLASGPYVSIWHAHVPMCILLYAHAMLIFRWTFLTGWSLRFLVEWWKLHCDQNTEKRAILICDVFTAEYSNIQILRYVLFIQSIYHISDIFTCGRSYWPYCWVFPLNIRVHPITVTQLPSILSLSSLYNQYL